MRAKRVERIDYKGEELAMRLERFGGRVVRVCEKLPQSRAGRHIQDQVLRSGTAVGAHYCEAQGAQSRKDFVYKISLALKEAREARYWLGVVLNAGYGESKEATATLDESTELIAILQASQTKARTMDDQS
jgi:four helix bundle protein